MADYGFAWQTFNLSDNTVELVKAGLAFGISGGFFDASDVAPILFSIKQIDTLTATTNAQKNTVDSLAKTPFPNGVSLGGSTNIFNLSRPPYIP
jgi:hypothetical protein